VTVGDWLRRDRHREGGAERVLETLVVMEWTLRVPRTRLLTHPEMPIPATRRQTLQARLDRLAEGEPLAYLLRRWEFFSLSLAISPAVLVPRPETELIVERALALISSPCRVLDIGTGSGAIACALARHTPATLYACDLSLRALRVCRRNVHALGLGGRVHAVHADLFPARPRRFDLIVANPPYLAAGEWTGLADRVRRWEPREALVSGPSGLETIDRILAGAPGHLMPGGTVLVEIGFGQEERVRELARREGYASVTVHPDLAGIPRVCEATLA